VDYLRKKTKRATVPLDEALTDSDPEPGLVAERKLDIEQLALVTKRLTKAQQEVISLRFTGELSVAEVAKFMRKSEGAVKALQHSAIVSLRKVLSVG
ncbi:RNA polymerase sigma factor, partial [Chloroflexota bacterium]